MGAPGGGGGGGGAAAPIPPQAPAEGPPTTGVARALLLPQGLARLVVRKAASSASSCQEDEAAVLLEEVVVEEPAAEAGGEPAAAGAAAVVGVGMVVGVDSSMVVCVWCCGVGWGGVGWVGVATRATHPDGGVQRINLTLRSGARGEGGEKGAATHMEESMEQRAAVLGVCGRKGGARGRRNKPPQGQHKAPTPQGMGLNEQRRRRRRERPTHQPMHNGCRREAPMALRGAAR